MSKYRGEMSLAFREHLLGGKSITRLEGVVFFGLASITKEISQLRKEGWTISSRKIPYPAVIRRINEHAVFQPAPQVPIKEISMTEYWVNE